MAAGSLLTPDVQEDTPQMPPIAPPPASASPAQPLPGAQAPAAAPGAPSIQNGAGQPQKGQIATGPEQAPEYDQKKLAKAQTTLDLLNAMKPKSRNAYMSWWQQQHGDIDKHYDNLQKQLGDRPADEQAVTRKEKFAGLLEFGLHLMQNSARPTPNQGAVLTDTLAGSIQNMDQQHQAGIQQDQAQYDAQANAIEQGRTKAQAGIGTPASAMKGQMEEDKADASELKDTAGAFKDISSATTEKASTLGAPTYATGSDGSVHALVRDADGHVHAEPVTGIDGKPYKGRVLGRTTGSGIEKGDTAQIRNQKYLSGVLGLDEDTAVKISFKPKTGNPSADHLAIYKSVEAATMGDDAKAKRAADQYIIENYGAHALQHTNGTIVPQQPPPAALQSLKPGKVTTFANGTKWTVGIDGKPRQVNAELGSQAIH